MSPVDPSVIRRKLDLQLSLCGKQIEWVSSSQGLSRMAAVQALILQMNLALDFYLEEVSSGQVTSLNGLSTDLQLDFRGQQLLALKADRQSWLNQLCHLVASLQQVEPVTTAKDTNDSNVILAVKAEPEFEHWLQTDEDTLRNLLSEFARLVAEHRALSWEG